VSSTYRRDRWSGPVLDHAHGTCIRVRIAGLTLHQAAVPTRKHTSPCWVCAGPFYAVAAPRRHGAASVLRGMRYAGGMRPAALAALVLLAACGEPQTTRDGGADATEPPEAPPSDAGPAWAQLGCVPVDFCIAREGSVSYCPQVHEDERNSWDCRRWLRCPPERDCFACREWSSDPRWTVEPEGSYPDQPPCTGQLCPVLDGGDGVPTCGDAGPF
jgi:hypothetical protein